MTAYTNGEAQKRMDRQTNGQKNKKTFYIKTHMSFVA